MVAFVSEILAQYMVTSGIGGWADDSPFPVWPITTDNMPENDKQWIKVQGVGATDGSRQMRGEVQKFPEWQIRLRVRNDTDPKTKGEEIAALFDATYMASVSWEGRNYRIQNIRRNGDLAFLKQEEREEMRSYVMNGSITIYEV